MAYQKQELDLDPITRGEDYETVLDFTESGLDLSDCEWIKAQYIVGDYDGAERKDFTITISGQSLTLEIPASDSALITTFCCYDIWFRIGGKNRAYVYGKIPFINSITQL